jgi:hypothetical protein
MGAPGYITYWLGLAVFLLEYSLHFAPELKGLVVLTLQVDFALIMLSAGLYKMLAGYANNHGMELGMANPQWGYWAGFYAKMPPTHALFKTLDHLAWSTEVVAAVLMLIPQTRFWGGLLIFLSFIFIATQIRLGLLCEMVMACCLIFCQPGSPGDQLLTTLLPAQIASPVASSHFPIVNFALGAALVLYLFLTPLAHAGLFYNLFAHRRIPGVLQNFLEAYTNCFGIIVWRVFSADLTNFFVRVFERPATSTESRTMISRYGWKGSSLFNYVCEAITLTSLFTTRKYHPSNPNLFQQRLLRYARALRRPPGSLIEFEYVGVRKATKSFEYVPAVLYTVDPVSGEVREENLDESICVSAPHEFSPIVEGTRPGSYVPLTRQT